MASLFNIYPFPSAVYSKNATFCTPQLTIVSPVFPYKNVLTLLWNFRSYKYSFPVPVRIATYFRTHVFILFIFL